MATQKPRLTITMDQDIYDAVKEFTTLTNGTVSGLISDCLRTALPQLNLVSATLRKLKEGQAEFDHEAKERLEKQLKQIERIGELATDQMDIFVDGWIKKT